VYFVTGYVNLCSTAVYLSDQSHPTRNPTPSPSHDPTHRPTEKPTWKHSNPTQKPTPQPTRTPSRKPSKEPTRNPSRKPTSRPSPSPHHDGCYDDEDYGYNGDYWKVRTNLKRNAVIYEYIVINLVSHTKLFHCSWSFLFFRPITKGL